jgi:predicted NACHT family NTPase
VITCRIAAEEYTFDQFTEVEIADLTFHEYFTARWFMEKANGDFGALVRHVTDKQWREVFLLTVEMLESTADKADKLVLGMKREIDGLLTQDEKLQQFLGWAEEKSRSAKNHFKSAVRAHYINLDRDMNLDYSLDFDCNRGLNLARALDLNLAHSRTLTRVLSFDRNLDSDRNFGLLIDFDLVADLALILFLEIGCTELYQSIQQLKDRLPYPIENHNHFKHWWRANGQAWTEELRAIMIEHRNIGHNWQFSEAQKELLQQYYDANNLLVECLNSDCYVSREVRAEIEASLLLPIKSQ